MYVGILRDTKANNKNLNLSSGFVESLDELEGLSFDDNLMIQPLDLDYVKIIGFQNNIQIAGFDMMYFDQFKHGGLIKEIKNYPEDFRKGYLAYRKDPSKRWLKLDYKKTIVLKMKSNIRDPYGLPLGLSALFEMKFAEDYRDRQAQTIRDLATSIYYLILPESEKKGQCALNKNQQNQLRTAFSNVVSNQNNEKSKIGKITLPPGTTLEKMQKDSSLLKDSLTTDNNNNVSLGLGFASAALNAVSEGGASYSSLQVNIDLILSQIFQIVEQIAIEYTRVLNYKINEKLNITHKTKDKELGSYVYIHYLHTSNLNQDRQYERAQDLYTKGMGSLKYWIATAGIDPDMYLSLMEEELDEGIYDKFKPHETSFTISDKNNDDEGGRDKKNDSELTNSGIQTRTNGSNELRK